MEQPRATYLEDEHHYVWDDMGVELVFERFREERGELKADVQPRNSNGHGSLPPEKLNLGSARSLKTYANTLASRGMYESEEWVTLLSQACELAVKRYREGDPTVVLADVDWRERPRFIVDPYIEHRGTTIWFGDGGVSKSLHALAAALSVATGQEILPGGHPVVQGPVIYMDWEADEETHAERLAALCGALEIDIPREIIYSRRAASIAESVRELRRAIALEGAVMAVVDSIGAAAGGDPEKAEPIIRAMNAIRALDVPTLAIHHVTKDQRDKSKPFGSVYSPNLARLTWRIDREQDEGSELIRVRFTNFKANNNRLMESRGHGVQFENEPSSFGETLELVRFIPVSGFALPNIGNRQQEGGLKNAIAKALMGGKRTVKELAIELDAKENTVLQTLRRDKDGWFQHLDDGSWGLHDMSHDTPDSRHMTHDNDRRPPLGGPVMSAVTSEEEEEESPF